MRSCEARQLPSLDWLRASFCQNGECVEITSHNGMVVMRNSTKPGSALHFTPEEFSAFLTEAKMGGYSSTM
jgi:Domain of unknown function (DUF397)